MTLMLSQLFQLFAFLLLSDICKFLFCEIFNELYSVQMTLEMFTELFDILFSERVLLVLFIISQSFSL